MAKFDRFTKALAVTTFPRAIKVLFEDGYKNGCGTQLCSKNRRCPPACTCVLLSSSIGLCGIA
jgi:hypothetical protein